MFAGLAHTLIRHPASLLWDNPEVLWSSAAALRKIIQAKISAIHRRVGSSRIYQQHSRPARLNKIALEANTTIDVQINHQNNISFIVEPNSPAADLSLCVLRNVLLQNHAQIQHLRRLDRSLQREDGQHHIIIQPETGCNSTELTLIDRWVHQCRPQTMCGFVEADHAGNRSGSHNPNNEVNHTQLAALN